MDDESEEEEEEEEESDEEVIKPSRSRQASVKNKTPQSSSRAARGAKQKESPISSPYRSSRRGPSEISVRFLSFIL